MTKASPLLLATATALGLVYFCFAMSGGMPRNCINHTGAIFTGPC